MPNRCLKGMRTPKVRLCAAMRISTGILVAATTGVGLAACGGSPKQVGHQPSVTSKQVSTSVTGAAARSYRLADVAFLTKALGHGEFVSNQGTHCTAAVGATSDGGTHFGPLVPVVSWNCNLNPPVGTLAFDALGDGFLYGPKLYVSHNGGRSWTASSQPGQVLAIAAMGTSVWMLQADCRAVPRQVRCPLRLLESADGGRSWAASTSQPTGSVTGYNGAVATESAAGQTWLLRTGAFSGYVLGAPGVNPMGRPDGAPIWFTDNSGASWSARSVRCGLDGLSVAASVAPSGTIFAVCAGQPGVGFQQKSVARSVDGGRSWTLQPSCGGAICPREWLDFGYLGAIDAVSGRTLYLVGERSSLLVSRDGGAHWQVVRQVTAGSDAGTSQVIFFDRSDGLVLGQDFNDNELPTLWITSDGGVHWAALHPVIG